MGGFAVNEQGGFRTNSLSSSENLIHGREDAMSSTHRGRLRCPQNQVFFFGLYHHPNVTAAAKTIRMDPEEFAVSSDPDIERFVHHVKYAPTQKRRLPVFEEIVNRENGFSRQ